MIKVLIVEDSRTVSQYLEFIINNDPNIEVIGNVANGQLAVDFMKKKRPDIITMDVDMPVMNGLEATRIIMSTTAVPIIVVTASRNAHDMQISIEALAAGALTVIRKPVGIGHPDEEEKVKKLLSMIKTYSQVKVITRKYITTKKTTVKTYAAPKAQGIVPTVGQLQKRKIVAVGISSGGPEVLSKIFSKITGKFPHPILVVQHITQGFLEGMVKWFDRLSKIPVRIASDGEKLMPGNIYFAPDNFQMEVNFNRIKLRKCVKDVRICPSVKCLFNSLAIHHGKETLAMILTGMGRDGAMELKTLRDAGALTIAQDKESSLVHGMPGEAIKLNGAAYILDPDQIADVLLDIENCT
ncbi:MAG: hypothetical protein B6D64_04950 [Bacteroidetes bacterium 4484_276]|nr:MAG: hypothetical protein B6D64_04950 [Bacteroidetes bacterium 4484_276]